MSHRKVIFHSLYSLNSLIILIAVTIPLLSNEIHGTLNAHKRNLKTTEKNNKF